MLLNPTEIIIHQQLEQEECLICFNNIQLDTGEYILLECCNKQVHIDCLCTWIKSCDNMDKITCPYCRQKSILCNDIYNSLTIQNISNISNISHNIDFSNDDINNQEIINLHNLDDNYAYCIFSKCIYKICTVIIFIVFVQILFQIIYNKA